MNKHSYIAEPQSAKTNGHIPDRCGEVRIDPEKVRTAQAYLIDGLTATHLAEVFKVLGDPTRVRILSALSQQTLCVCDIAAVLGMSQSAISHQLRLLRVMGLVRGRKEGRLVYYSLDDEHVHRLFQMGLEHVRHG